jgi:hypothetical protein
MDRNHMGGGHPMNWTRTRKRQRRFRGTASGRSPNPHNPAQPPQPGAPPHQPRSRESHDRATIAPSDDPIHTTHLDRLRGQRRFLGTS